MSIRNHFRLPEFRGPHLTDDYSTQNVTAPVRTASSPNSWLSRFSQREARAIFTRFFVGKTSIFSSSIVLLSDSRRQWSIESAHVRSAPFTCFFTFSLRLVNISQNFFFFSGPWWRMAMIYRDLVRARLWFEFQFCDVTSLVLKKKKNFFLLV